jgi:uncharacterized damage-inducible protein DinB
MDLIKTHYLERHNTVHNSMRKLIEPLSEQQMRSRPHESVNSIAWIFWHVARAEDIALNRLASDGSQVFDDEGWAIRLHVPLRHFGVDMTKAEVSTLSEQIDLAALRAYWDAVGKRTLQVIDALDGTALSLVVSPEYIHKLVYDEGVGGTAAEFVQSVWRDRTRGNYLMYLGLTHAFTHFGEAGAIRSLLGVQ